MNDNLHPENAAESDWQTIKQTQGDCSCSRAAAGSIQLEQSVIRIKGHGERIANAYVNGYYFLETDTDGPFIDTVHESFVESNAE